MVDRAQKHHGLDHLRAFAVDDDRRLGSPCHIFGPNLPRGRLAEAKWREREPGLPAMAPEAAAPIGGRHAPRYRDHPWRLGRLRGGAGRRAPPNLHLAHLGVSSSAGIFGCERHLFASNLPPSRMDVARLREREPESLVVEPENAAPDGGRHAYWYTNHPGRIGDIRGGVANPSPFRYYTVT